jgi:hypothetical protein
MPGRRRRINFCALLPRSQALLGNEKKTDPRSAPVEEALVVVLQLFFEVVVQSLGWLPLDLAAGSGRTERGCGWVLFHAAVGGLLGFVSTLISPHLLLPVPWMRVLNLLAAPLVAGGLAYLFATHVRPGGRRLDPRDHFAHAALFAFMFGAARFAFAPR